MNKLDLKLKKGLAKAILKVEGFKKEMGESLDLKKAVMDNLNVLECEGYDVESIKNLIYVETDWLVMFMRLQQFEDEEILFGVIEANYTNMPQLVVGSKSVDGKNYEIPIKLLAKDKDFFVINNITRSSIDLVGTFFRNRFADFLGEEWTRTKNFK